MRNEFLAGLSLSMDSKTFPVLPGSNADHDPGIPDRILEQMVASALPFLNSVVIVDGLPEGIGFVVDGKARTFRGGFTARCQRENREAVVSIVFDFTNFPEAKGKQLYKELGNGDFLAAVGGQTEAEWLLMNFLSEMNPSSVVLPD